jgi:hypothetical protein
MELVQFGDERKVGDNDQVWTLNLANGSADQYVITSTGSLTCMDVPASTTAEGAQLLQV